MSDQPQTEEKKPGEFPARVRLPSFKIHEESEENLELMKQFKEDNQTVEVKRHRINSLE